MEPPPKRPRNDDAERARIVAFLRRLQHEIPDEAPYHPVWPRTFEEE